MNRRSIISEALDKAVKGPPSYRTTSGQTPLQELGENIRHEHDLGLIVPGGMVRVLKNCVSKEDKQFVHNLIKAGEGHKELGKYGDLDRVARTFGIDRPLLDMTIEHVEMDYVADELQHRRGSDADLEIPEVSRRDELEAAYDAHVNQENDHA